MSTGWSEDQIAASRRARRQRRVDDWERCRAGGLDRLLDDGEYRHPRIAELDADERDTGVLLFKPPTRVTGETLLDLDERVAECGYVIAEARLVSAGEMRDRNLARRHYHLHQTIAERGVLQPDERQRLLRIYDREEFWQRHGRPAADVPVMPVYTFIAESGIPEERIREWSAACARAKGLDSGSIDAANELADCKYVNLFPADDARGTAPVFLLNAHMPAVIGELEGASRPVAALRLLAASAAALPWPRLRVAFSGSSDPACAPPGSLRRDAYEGVFPLRLESGERIDRTRNGIHLSDGPLEALREIAIWFERHPATISIGRALARRTSIDLEALIDRPFVRVDGRRQSLKLAARGKGIHELATMLAHAQLFADEQADEAEPSRKEGRC